MTQGLLSSFWPILMIIGLGCASSPPPSSPGTATLSVTVVAEPNPRLRPDASGVGTYGGPENAPRQLTPVDYAHLEGIVIWLERTDGQAIHGAPSAQIISIENTSGTSDPQVLGVSVGSQVTIENKTRQAQVIFSASRGNEFDLGTVPPNGRGSFVARTPGEIEIFTESAVAPVAVVYAVPSPIVRTVMANKAVRFTELAPGGYRAVCWSARLPGSHQSISLLPDQDQKVTLKVGVSQLPKR